MPFASARSIHPAAESTEYATVGRAALRSSVILTLYAESSTGTTDGCDTSRHALPSWTQNTGSPLPPLARVSAASAPGTSPSDGSASGNVTVISTVDTRLPLCTLCGTKTSLSSASTSPATSTKRYPRRLATVPAAVPCAANVPRNSAASTDVTSVPRATSCTDASNQRNTRPVDGTNDDATPPEPSPGVNETSPLPEKSKFPTTIRSPRSLRLAAIQLFLSRTSVIVSHESTTVPGGRTPLTPPERVHPLMSIASSQPLNRISSSAVLPTSEIDPPSDAAGSCASGMPAERFCA